ncbi:uncharacterized protein LOC106091503 [Stomoxys calcitrans]|uniref:uncharacterized protein LOC106091503 n=1 Tax=Stomoxys calcitrans TaxID=35570 RepID=UPI0027E36C10|nr:uncharacterized protein LOC106091503 [Stomoxys calcitrans]
MASAKINFHIKLLSGGCVVLIEAPGYDSEIFTPTIDANKRISLVNIITNRRCCSVSNAKASKTSIGNVNVKKESDEAKSMRPPATNSFLRNSVRHNKENLSVQMRPPLANSTPGKFSVPGNIKNRTSINITPDTFGSMSSQFDLPTPEPLRRAIPQQQRSEVVNNSDYNLPRGIKVMRLYHNSRDGTPSKVGRLISSSPLTSSARGITREDFHNMSSMSSSFRINPPTPSAKGSQQLGVFASTPIKRQPPTTQGVIQNSNSKWRGGKKTIRTYSKRCKVVQIRTPQSSAKKFRERVLPSFLRNPTQAPKPEYQVEIRKRRSLIVDGKVRISSRKFKRQQQPNEGANSKLRISTTSVSFTALQRSRKMPMSAFDLLTNSNRVACLSSKLTEQFRKGCINKASSTNSKYKILANVPPLEEDEEVLELTQSLLPSFSSISAGQTSHGNEQNCSKEIMVRNPLSQPVTRNVPKCEKIILNSHCSKPVTSTPNLRVLLK